MRQLAGGTGVVGVDVRQEDRRGASPGTEDPTRRIPDGRTVAGPARIDQGPRRSAGDEVDVGLRPARRAETPHVRRDLPAAIGSRAGPDRSPWSVQPAHRRSPSTPGSG